MLAQGAARTNKAKCSICPHACLLDEGQVGICRARYAKDGEVVCGNYGRISSFALDPIEKKPLARFFPGTYVLSFGSYGCNLRCPFCQNASIATASADEVEWHYLTPKMLVDTALNLHDKGCIGLAFTYNEPFISYEFVRDTARLAHEKGLVNVVVSNGMINEEPLEDLLPLIDAANIDLKAWSEEAYRRLGGNLQAVKACIEHIAQNRCHLEVTTLVVPGLSDDEEDIDEASLWLASLNPSIPYHLTRFFPAYRMLDASPTPIAKLKRLARIAGKHLDDVILGNV